MKKLACAITVAGLIGTPAFAADIPTKAPAPAPAPVYNWTGWYVGVNAGASMGNVKTDFNGAPAFSTAPLSPITPGFGFSDRTYPSGFIGGGQIGYNWQYSPLIVVGVEADIQGALEKDGSNNINQNFTGFPTPGGPGCIAAGVFSTSGCTSVTSYTTQIDWFGTVRARLGYVWGNGEVVSYVTGGLAYGEVKVNGTNNTSGFFCIASCQGGSPFTSIQNFSQSHVNTGWVLGYGNEGHLPLMPGNWTWKVETLYMDLGHLSSTGAGSLTCTVCGNALSGGQFTTNSHFTDWILRGGLNYRF